MLRAFTDSFEVFGEWFLPGHPESTTAGTLTYSPQKAELHLAGTLQKRAGFPGLIPTQKYPVIQGITRDNEPITLFDALSNNLSFMAGPAGTKLSETLRVPMIIAGMHAPAACTFPEMRCRVPGLQIWQSRKLVERKYHDEESELFATYQLPSVPGETIRLDSIAADLTFGVDTHDSFNPFALNIGFSGKIHIGSGSGGASATALRRNRRIKSIIHSPISLTNRTDGSESASAQGRNLNGHDF